MIHLIDHPLIADMLAQARRDTTPPAVFRRVLKQIGAMLLYEALRDAPQQEQEINTPLEAMMVKRLKPPLTIVPILRAGLGLAEAMLDFVPEARMGHILLQRDETTLEPVYFYEKLPDDIAAGPVILVDPMLATGGSLVAAYRKLAEVGCDDVRIVCLVAAPEGVQRMQAEAPNAPIFTAALDRQLDHRGFIVPGLGDAGDRLYGTE